jgi:hypothetical protein
MGVFCRILVFDELPADPAAVARTALCASSSDSALKAVVARDLILFMDVSSGSWFKLAETVLASFAKFVVACCTAAMDGFFEDDPDATLAVPPLVEPFAVVVCPEYSLALLDCPVEAFVVLNPELFEVASVLISLKPGDAASVVISLKSAFPLKFREVT